MKISDDVSIETLLQKSCTGADGQVVDIVEKRFVASVVTAAGPRRYPGARFWETSSGERLKIIDQTMFEIVSTGELLLVES